MTHFLSGLNWYDNETWDNSAIVTGLKITLFVLLGLAAVTTLLSMVSFTVNNTDEKARGRSFAMLKIGLWLTVLLGLSLALFYIGTSIDKDTRPILFHGMRALSFTLAVILCIAVEFSLHREQNSHNTREITFAAVCIALSFVLSCVRLFRMPQGGSVTLGRILPLSVYCFYFGFKKGALAGFAYSVLELLQDPWIINPWQMLLEYTIAFTAICVVGAFAPLRKKIGRWAIFIGMIVYGCIRYLCHLLTGALVFAEIVHTESWAWLYSAGYNAFVFADLAVAIVLGLLLFSTNHFPRYMERFASRRKKLESINN